ncbi:lysozyme family protein [Blautia sp. CLA-JM-H16]|uniref:Lysozyme family protein n=1 Tax=Blautia aquisgranensis TaxID=3133153 RepID=A0ABV1BIA2_9FIRM
MNTKTKNPKLTKKQRQLLRVRQVRRQKIMLGCLFLVIIVCLISLFMRFPSRQQNAYQINSSCESYRDEVTAEAAQYGMSDYVDLILAVMMQESSGHGNDPMQSSEGSYNTQYPQEPNGITDPSYSIACGIQELKYALDKAGCTSPDDLPHIRLALQAYNFGADSYFSYLEKNGETTWTAESAQAFAQMASGGKERDEDDPLHDPAGPWAYGDQYYPDHVLRYYHTDSEA